MKSNQNTNAGCHRVANGFSLIELMIAIVVAAVLAGIAAPSFNTLIKNNRMTNKVNDIVVAINMARQVAISRSLVTFVCHSNNADTAAPACNGGTASDWGAGYLVYTAAPRTLVTTQRNYASASDTLIQQTDLQDNDGITITDINANAANFISYGAGGLLFGSGAVQLQICDDRTGEQGKLIKVSAAGRISTETATGTNVCS